MEDYEPLMAVAKRRAFVAELGLAVATEERLTYSTQDGPGLFAVALRNGGCLIFAGRAAPRQLFWLNNASQAPAFCGALLDAFARGEAAAKSEFPALASAYALVKRDQRLWEREAMERHSILLQQHGWCILPDEENFAAWVACKEKLGFRARMQPAISAQRFSLTFDASFYCTLFFEDRSWDRRGYFAAETEVKAAFLDCLILCTKPSETVLMIESNHNGYKFRPHSLERTESLKLWPFYAAPIFEYQLYMTEDLRLGIMGDPNQRTIYVFGECLADRFSRLKLAHLPVARPPGS